MVDEKRSLLQILLNQQRNWLVNIMRGDSLLRTIVEGRMEGTKRKEEDQEWCYRTGWWESITASWKRELDIVVNGVIGRTNLQRKAENPEEEEDTKWRPLSEHWMAGYSIFSHCSNSNNACIAYLHCYNTTTSVSPYSIATDGEGFTQWQAYENKQHKQSKTLHNWPLEVKLALHPSWVNKLDQPVILQTSTLCVDPNTGHSAMTTFSYTCAHNVTRVIK